MIAIEAHPELSKRNAQIQVQVLRPRHGGPGREGHAPAAVAIREVLYEPSATTRYRNVGVQSTCARCPTRVSPRPAIRGEMAAGPELLSTEAVNQSAGANLT